MSKLPELLEKSARRQIDRFCKEAAQDPHQPRHLDFRISGNQIDLFEKRRYRNDPTQHQELPMAKIRYTPELNQWSLHHQHGDRWQLYLNAPPSLDLGRLLLSIKQDPMGYFWQE